jgi:hypothetical protein
MLPSSGAKLLSWPTDLQTAQAAMSYPLPLKATTPAAQFGEDGNRCGFDPRSWNNRVIQPAVWPPGHLKCTPAQIMAQFSQARYTQALAMVACWGLMWRQPNAIWGSRNVKAIEHTTTVRLTYKVLAASISCAIS